MKLKKTIINGMEIFRVKKDVVGSEEIQKSAKEALKIKPLKTWKNEDGFSTFAFSGIGGLEYMITDELFIDARYSYGITNILDKDLTSVEAKNSNIQFGFGIKI